MSPMMQARTTAGEAPTKRVKTIMPRPESISEGFLPKGLKSAIKMLTMSVILYPEMAIMCVSPVMRKSSLRSSGSPLRDPRRRPAMKEADGSVEKVRFMWVSKDDLMFNIVLKKTS